MEAGSRSTRVVGVAAVLVVAAVAGLSLASSLLGQEGSGDEEPVDPSASAPASTTQPETSGPALGDPAALPPPEPGRFSGRLMVIDADCNLADVDLTTLRTTVLARDVPGCTALLSADGGTGVFVGRPGAAVQRFVVWSDQTVDAGEGPPLGPAGYGPPAVSNGGAVAVCHTAAVTNRPETTVTEDGRSRSFPGCRPVFAGERLLLALRGGPAAVREGAGTVIVARDALPRASRGDLVLGTDTGGRLLAVMSRTESLDRVDLAVFTTDGEPRGAWRDVHSGADLRTVRIASTGEAAAIDVNGVWRLLALAPDGADAVESVAGDRIADVDFAPDGRAAAVLVDGAILLVDAGTLGPVASIRIDARSVRWLP